MIPICTYDAFQGNKKVKASFWYDEKKQELVRKYGNEEVLRIPREMLPSARACRHQATKCAVQFINKHEKKGIWSTLKQKI